MMLKKKIEKKTKKESGVELSTIPEVPKISENKVPASFLVDDKGKISFHFNSTQPMLKYPTQELIQQDEDNGFEYTYYFSKKKVCIFSIKISDIASVKMENTGRIISLEIKPKTEIPTRGTNGVEYELEAAKIWFKTNDEQMAREVAENVSKIRNYLVKKMSLEKVIAEQ